MLGRLSNKLKHERKQQYQEKSEKLQKYYKNELINMVAKSIQKESALKESVKEEIKSFFLRQRSRKALIRKAQSISK